MNAHKDTLHELLQPSDGPVLSMYMPTTRRGEDVKQGPIRFKNLSREALDLLEPKLDRASLDQVRDALAKIQGDQDFWQHRTEGLALFVRDGEAYTYDLTESVDERVVVDDLAHVLPMLAAYQHLSAHYILELHKDDVRIFRGDGLGQHQLKKEDMPESFHELFDDLDAESDLNTGSYAGTDGAYHGHRAKPEEEEKDKEKYYRYLDDQLTPYFKSEGLPVLLAGVGENIADWRNLTDDAIYLEADLGKPMRDYEPDELADALREIFRTLDDRAVAGDMERLGKGLASDRAETDLDRIASALEMGRVEKLLIRSDYKEDRRSTLDRLVKDTLAQGGDVVVVEPSVDAMDKQVAALYRY